MSKKIINLGKVKGRTLDLKVDNKVLKKKYDDEIEWQELGKVGGIDTVDTVNDLPVDAEKDDIAFVKEAAFVERVEYQEEVPIIIQDSEQTFNIELKQNPMYLSDVDLKEKHPELIGEYSAMMVTYLLESPYGYDGEIEVQCNHFTSSVMSTEFGVNHNLDFYMFNTFNPDESITRWIKLRGMSIKDYFTMILGIEVDDEQLQILLGEHYADNTTDNPSYGWIKFNGTSEPLNENSIVIEGMYATIEFDAVADLKLTGAFASIDINIIDTNGDEDCYFEFDSQDSEDYEPEKITTAFGYANTFVNLLFSGGTKDASYDVYSKKGFHKFDEEWKSLEEEMNIPKVVEKHSDLPKSFIENGIMVVANEEEKLPEPTTKLETFVPVIIKVNPTPSVKDEIEKLKQYLIDNGASSDVDWDNCSVSLFGYLVNEDEEEIGSFGVNTSLSENGFAGIILDLKTTMDDIYVKYYYFDNAGAEIYVPRIDNNTPSSTYITDEGKCWYRMKYLLGEKKDTLISPPQKVKYEDWFNISDISAYCIDIYCDYDDDNGNYDDIEPSFYEFANLFRIYDESKSLIYPKGFYMYARNQWWHQPGIAGESFDNVDVLRAITAEDVGNIQENTEKRHEHSNKYILDQINDQTISNIDSNTSARHTHSNQSYLDQIDNQTINNINSNTNARHEHNNLSVLSRINDDMVNSMNKINSGFFAFNQISAKSVSMQLPEETNGTLLFSGIIDHSGYILPFNLTLNQAYLVVFDGIRYKFMYTSNKIGDKSKYGFEIVPSAGYTTVYTADDGKHDFSISIIKSSMTNLADYINALELKILYLESKLQS